MLLNDFDILLSLKTFQSKSIYTKTEWRYGLWRQKKVDFPSKRNGIMMESQIFKLLKENLLKLITLKHKNKWLYNSTLHFLTKKVLISSLLRYLTHMLISFLKLLKLKNRFDQKESLCQNKFQILFLLKSKDCSMKEIQLDELLLGFQF